MGNNVPVVGLVGFTKSGKTTFLEKLVSELKGRGYKVGVIKHTHHHINIDKPGTDTWRHAQAGAEMVALAAQGCISVIKTCAGDPEPEQVISMFDGVDIVIVEGYKRGRWPKIIINLHNTPEMPDAPPVDLLAVVGGALPDDASYRLGFDDIVNISANFDSGIVKSRKPDGIPVSPVSRQDASLDTCRDTSPDAMVVLAGVLETIIEIMSVRMHKREWGIKPADGDRLKTSYAIGLPQMLLCLPFVNRRRREHGSDALVRKQSGIFFLFRR